MTKTARLLRALLGPILVAAGLAACSDPPSLFQLRPVLSGTVSGVGFTVTGGTVYQASIDGPLFVDASGGQLVLDDGPAGLGMSDPQRLQLRTQFALQAGGSLLIAAYADPGSEFSTGLSVQLHREDTAIEYEFQLGGAPFADSVFTPAPAAPSAEHWVVTEFYASEVPGYGGGTSGITMWELNNLSPAFNEDVLRCDPGPAMQASTLSGDRVGYALQSGWIIAVEAVDAIVGPCE